MKVVGLIAEYNPFHSGHFFHIEEARRQSQADFVLVIMSGNFVQRGTPAILDKYARAEMALLCGADAVIELPVRFSCASAEYFAHGAVFLLELLGVTDFLCFGSECGNLTLLQSVTQYLTKESSAFQKTIQTYLKQGCSYPAARAKAFFDEIASEYSESFKKTDKYSNKNKVNQKAISSILSEPNNILALEYLKALKRIHSRMIPLTVQRQEAGYHDKSLYQNFASATALRDILLCQNPHAVKAYIPEAAFSVLEREYAHSFPIVADDFSLPLYYKIRSDIEQGIPLSSYQDISPDLEARILNRLNQFTSFDSFAMLLKTKQYTLTRMNRCLLHILLNIKKTVPFIFNPEIPETLETLDINRKADKKTDTKPELPSYFFTGIPSYARLLGFRKSSSALLSAIKAHSAIPLITKMADAQTILSNRQTAFSDTQTTFFDTQNAFSDLQNTSSNVQNISSNLQNPFCNLQNLSSNSQSRYAKDAFSFFKQDRFAADLYRKTQELKFHTTLANEFTHPLVLLP